MKKMIHVKRLLVGVCMAVLMIGAYSCLDDNDNVYPLYPDALVTVKPTSENSFFLQLDDKTTLLPVNVQTPPYGDKEVRAFVNYKEVDQDSGVYDKAIHLQRIDSILTKQMAPNLLEKNDSVYGTDPVEIMNVFATIAEDGYLTLCFSTVWGGSSKPHYVNLISTNNPDDPYEVEFRHHAYGDIYGQEGWGYVAFNLNSLPNTQGETVKLTLKWKSYNGEKSTQFDYTSKRATLPAAKMTYKTDHVNVK